MNHNLIHVVAVTVTLLAVPRAQAASFSFTDISQKDLDNVTRELSANSTIHNVMPPSSMGSIFGFEVGVVAGVTKTPEIQKLVKEASPSTDVPALPHAGLHGALTVPFGITAEATIVPKIKSSEAEYSQFTGAVKFSLSDGLLSMLPLNLAVRGFYSKTDFSFQQTISGVSTNVDYTGNVMGAHVMVSPKFLPIIEPYVGLGYLSAKGDMSLSGTSTFFNFTSAQKAESKPTSSHVFAGITAKLLLLSIGVEYARMFDTQSYTGKLALGF